MRVRVVEARNGTGRGALSLKHGVTFGGVTVTEHDGKGCASPTAKSDATTDADIAP